jgi:hypothetical protein
MMEGRALSRPFNAGTTPATAGRLWSSLQFAPRRLSLAASGFLRLESATPRNMTPFLLNKKLKRSFPPQLGGLIFAAIMCTQAGHAEGRKERSGRPVLYNLIVKEADPVDQTIREQYGGRYDIVEVRDRTAYASPKLTKTRFPNPVFDQNNVEIAGSVRVCVVVTADGRLVDPVIVGPANPLLAAPVLEVLNNFAPFPRA